MHPSQLYNTISKRFDSQKMSATLLQPIASKFKIVPHTERVVTPEVEELFLMLKTADENNTRGVPVSEKVLHFIKIFQFVLDPRLKSLLEQNETFRLSVKTRIVNVTSNLQQLSIPYSISINFHKVTTDLMNYIVEIEKKKLD